MTAKQKLAYIACCPNGPRTIHRPVRPPKEDSKGWKYPFQGDDWPTQEDWYWTWMVYPSGRESFFPELVWWDSKKYEFRVGAKSREVVAWRPAPYNYVPPGTPEPMEYDPI
jgi:hypothetical protein